VSDTIQTRQHAARQAAMLQRRPGDLIESAENSAEALEGYFSRKVHVVYGHRNFHDDILKIVSGASRGFISALTARTQVMQVSTSWPTTAPESPVDSDECQTESSWERWVGQATEALQRGVSKERRPSTAAARLRVERLSTLQAAFGFTIQDLASVLGITRPQLYKWLDVANDIKLQEASRVRLATIERIAKEWTSRSRAPLSSVSKDPLDAGGTAFELLTAADIDEGAAIAALGELIAKLETKPKSRSQRLREAGFSRRPSVRSLPSDE
jgi:transcriptional regulator with XRE-family HTH domain